jgi:hypothetical protein
MSLHPLVGVVFFSRLVVGDLTASAVKGLSDERSPHNAQGDP